MATKRKNSACNLEIIYDIVTALENGEKAADLARKYNVKANTISDWKRSADKVKMDYESYEFGSTVQYTHLSLRCSNNFYVQCIYM